jgi:hypothetical protein
MIPAVEQTIVSLRGAVWAAYATQPRPASSTSDPSRSQDLG